MAKPLPPPLPRHSRRLVYAFLALLPLAGCGASPSAVANDKGGQDSVGTDPAGPGPVGGDHARDPAYTAPARLTVQLGQVGALSKSASIVMRRLLLTVVSNAVPADTVRDTVPLGGANAAQTLKRVVKLKPKLGWVLKARAFDQRDSMVHSGTSALFTPKPGDTAEVSLNLDSRYVMYQAVFAKLPATVNANAEGTERAAINFNRVLLKIDGQTKADSAVAGFFTPGQDVALNFDYVPAGTHSVTLEAYGIIGGFQGLLFSGSGSFTSAPGEDGSNPIALVWAGPDTGISRFTVILGRVGRVTVSGGFVSQL